ncbi:EP300-interacting inhibitor of differentiation 3-like [Saccoglossus kowalevskii]|uniref:Non-structural maintenance of chromosomes element 4 n=1 Tax=Saccoglossus kowalevskii TaxID=10224 RepID=A0ABM0N061_SACKO|nr:PREDICTED: non-structural maintenance of chromosomes element 4 homolog A-like [Saccoglossus kowalevskii]
MSGRPGSKGPSRKPKSNTSNRDTDKDEDVFETGATGSAEYVDKRRQIRHDYRTLITETQKNRLDLIRPDNTGLYTALTRADKLFNEVKKTTATREAALDSQFLVLAASLGNQQAHQLHTDLVAFEPTEFAEKLITFMKGRQIGLEGDDQQTRLPKEAWAKLGREALPCFRRVPAFHFMLGSFERGEIQKSKRSANRRRVTDKELGPKVHPQQLEKLQKNQQEVTTEEVEKVLEFLRQITSSDDGTFEPISFFEFVVNPESYAQTVENMFYLSFLVRDGHAEVVLDEDNLPVVTPREPYVEGQTTERVDRKQVVVTMDMEQWKEIIDVFEIEKPMIPTRSTLQEEKTLNGHIGTEDDSSGQDE